MLMLPCRWDRAIELRRHRRIRSQLMQSTRAAMSESHIHATSIRAVRHVANRSHDPVRLHLITSNTPDRIRPAPCRPRCHREGRMQSAMARRFWSQWWLRLFLLGVSRPALAWGRMGHRASAQSCRVAALAPEPGPSFATCSSPANRWPTRRPGPTRTAGTFPAARAGISSTCRSRPAHYDPRDCRRNGCVVSKIAEFRADPARSSHAPRRDGGWPCASLSISSRTSTSRCTSPTANDRGGNNLQLRYGRYDNTNLHQIWDSGLLYQGFRNETELVRRARRSGPPARIGQLAQRPNRRLGRRKPGIRPVAPIMIPGSKRLLRTGDLARPRIRTSQPAPGRRPRPARVRGVRLAFLLNGDLIKSRSCDFYNRSRRSCSRPGSDDGSGHRSGTDATSLLRLRGCLLGRRLFRPTCGRDRVRWLICGRHRTVPRRRARGDARRRSCRSSGSHIS